MNSKIFFLYVGLALLLFNSQSHAQEEMRFVLLKSGKIIEGKPFIGEAKTRIELSGGDYIVIPNEKVSKSFRQRNDIYNYRAAITPLQTQAQNELLRWLLTQRNYDFAAKHLAELNKHSRQLSKFDFDFWATSIRDKKFNLQPKKKESQSARTNSFFKNKVEGHLVLGCSLSGCHRANKESGFNLVGPLELNSTNELENMVRTKDILKRIGKSTFLEKVAQKHGPLRAAMYPKATREYLEIATWVNSQTLQTQAPRISIQKSKPKTIKSVPTIQNYKSTSKETKNPVTQATYEEVHEDFVPKDEFDPAIFNRLQQAKTNGVPKGVSELPKVESAPKRLISNEYR